MFGSWSNVSVPFQFGLNCDQGFLMLDTSYRLFAYLRRDQRNPADAGDSSGKGVAWSQAAKIASD